MISTDRVVEIVRELYGLSGHVSALGSCQDINFKFTTVNETGTLPVSYVVKFTNASQCTLPEIEFQHAVIEYLHTCKECNSIALPKPLAKGVMYLNSPWSTENECISLIEVGKISYYVRMLGYVDGIILSEFTYFSPEVLHSFGAFVATISKALVEFQTFLFSKPQLRAVANREIEW
jgi:Ser/Thr protein kinase RdoA (MazF antagonist)